MMRIPFILTSIVVGTSLWCIGSTTRAETSVDTGNVQVRVAPDGNISITTRTLDLSALRRRLNYYAPSNRYPRFERDLSVPGRSSCSGTTQSHQQSRTHQNGNSVQSRSTMTSRVCQ